MLILLSPAKSLDETSKPVRRGATVPRFLDDAAELVAVLREYSPDQLAALFDVSDELAVLNWYRFQAFHTNLNARTARPALATFAGDVYVGMDAQGSFDGRDFAEAQKTVRILSGLYGVLRPLDFMLPYRLEMGTTLATPRGNDLYSFWGTRITDLLEQDLAAAPGPEVVINVASAEYAKAVDLKRFDVVTPTFLDRDAKGELRVIAFHAKRARGAMARYLVQQRVRTRRAITGFADLGYVYDGSRSTPDKPVFVRASS